MTSKFYYLLKGLLVAILFTEAQRARSLIKSIAGGLRPTSGTIEFKGRRIDGKPPEDIARAGLSFVPRGAACLCRPNRGRQSSGLSIGLQILQAETHRG